MTAAPPDRRAIITEALRKIDDLTARLAIAEEGDTEPIAVVGVGCRLPGGVDSAAEYWRFLESGGDGVVRVPADRWDADAFYAPDHTTPGTIASRDGGFLTSWHPSEFDAEFFNISPREAAAMDPQQRLLLEVAWEALEHAGITAPSIRGSQTAVFVGVTTSDYLVSYAAKVPLQGFDPYVPFGTAGNFLAGRLSYFLGVHGPALAVDTACSSSLVTVHLACQSLRRRESDHALAAGVNLMLNPANSIATSRWGMLAPDGRCKTFDANADGYVRSEGCGVVVLKRLSDAVRDGDSVLAVVRGSAVNQDGPSSGQTVPNGPAQQAVLRAALAASRLEPADIDYIEAHGTGTALGDPIELGALAEVFGDRGGGAPLVLGSVKTNVGHLESAAGIAGFIKTVLCVQRGYIPAHLHFERLTPHAVAGASRFEVAAQGRAWPSVSRARRAGVSSFGVSGTNAHVVIEQAPVAESVARQPEPVVSTLVVSGKTPQRVAATAAMLAQWLGGAGVEVPLAEVAHTLAHHRTRYRHFAAVSARDRAAAVTGLQALAVGESAPGVVQTRVTPALSGRVFVYSGQGSQWSGMGQRLLAEEPAFAAAIEELEPVFVEQVGYSLRQILAESRPVTGDAQVQPVLMGLQLALTALWGSYGVKPDAVIGHSMGEVTAAVVAGALTPAQGLRVIAVRSQLMSRLAGLGAVALLELDAEASAELIAGYGGVELAGYVSPRQTVVAGPPEQVDAVIAAVAARERFARRVNMEVASHTALMDPILPELRTALGDLTPKAPTIPFFSTIAETTAPTLDADYWVDNLRQPVRFTQAVAMAGRDHGTFIEISPHPLLAHAITDTLAPTSSAEHVVVAPTLKRGEDETVFLHTQIAGLGVQAPTTGRRPFVDVPPSSWLHSKHWVDEDAFDQQRPDEHPLLGAHVEMPSGRDHVWQAEIEAKRLSWLTDQPGHGGAVLPAAVFVEMTLAAGCQALGRAADAVVVNELTIEQPLALDRRMRVTTQLHHGDGAITVEFHANPGGGKWRRYAVARVEVADPEVPPGQDVESSAAIVVPDTVSDHPKYRVHPAIIDAALRTLVAGAPADAHDPAETAYAPVSLQTIQIYGQVGRRARCRAEWVEQQQGGRLGHITLTDDTGVVTARLTGIELRPIDPGTMPIPLQQKMFHTDWVATAAPRPDSAPAAGSWLLLADDDAETTRLVADFTSRLRSPARQVISEKLSDESAVAGAVANAADAEPEPVAIVVFVGTHRFDDSDPDGTLSRVHQLITAISAAAGAAVDSWRTSPRLWLVSRRGLAVLGGEPGDPSIGALKGLIRTWRFPGEMARVLAGEPDVGATLVDLDDTGDPESPAAVLIRELVAPAHDDLVAWRDGRRYVERLARTQADTGGTGAVVRPDGSYIVTGGLGGLGLVVARWLIERGATRLILNGRTEPAADQQQALAELRRSADIVFVRGDIATGRMAEELVAAAEETGMPLRGVVHAAGVIDGGLVGALNRETLQRVWAAKAAGALRLHAATADRQLDWWVGFSSMAALLGLPGQVAYATANAWLDAVVAWRSASGLPAMAINWGQWADVGIGRSLSLSVMDPISPDEGVEALQSLVGGALTRVGVGRLRFDRALATTEEFRQLGYFTNLVTEFDTSAAADRQTADEADRSDALVADWSTIPAEDRRGELESRLRTILARELRMSPSAVDVDQPFPELGLDSMTAMTVVRDTQRLAGVDLSANMLFNHPTIASLAAYLADLLAHLYAPPEDGHANSAVELALEPEISVLDELFDQVESASAGSESGAF